MVGMIMIEHKFTFKARVYFSVCGNVCVWSCVCIYFPLFPSLFWQRRISGILTARMHAEMGGRMGCPPPPPHTPSDPLTPCPHPFPRIQNYGSKSGSHEAPQSTPKKVRWAMCQGARVPRRRQRWSAGMTEWLSARGVAHEGREGGRGRPEGVGGKEHFGGSSKAMIYAS